MHVCWANGAESRARRGSASSALGFQDGLLVPLAVVTGLAGADAASSTVVVGRMYALAAVIPLWLYFIWSPDEKVRIEGAPN